MANYNNLLSTINGAIRTNGTGAITGQLLQTILDGMVASLGAKYQYAGLATPATNPGTPDENVFYLASQAGTYTNFGGLVVNDGEVCALKWDGTWAKDVTGAATAEQVSQLGQYIDNPEWVRVVTDSEDKILYGVKTDGKFYFGDGCPPQVQDYVQSQIEAIGIDALLATKVDKVAGKSLIDANFASSQEVVENPEYLEVKTDSEGKILEAIDKEGTKIIGGDASVKGNVTVNGTSYQIVENPEWVWAIVDAENKILCGIRQDGKFVADIDELNIESIISLKNMCDGYVLKDTTKHTITVNCNGGGDFASIKGACEYILQQNDASYTNQYEIIVYPGTYNEYYIIVPPFTHIHGQIANTVLVTSKNWKDSEETYVYMSGSTGIIGQAAVFEQGYHANNKLSNLIIESWTGYCLHIDSSALEKGVIHNEGLTLIKSHAYQNDERGGNIAIIGGPCMYSKGGLYEFINCTFIGNIATRCYAASHTLNNVDTINSLLRFDGCVFQNSNITTVSQGCLSNAVLEIKNCIFERGKRAIESGGNRYARTAEGSSTYLFNDGEYHIIGSNNKNFAPYYTSATHALKIECDSAVVGQIIKVSGSAADVLFGYGELIKEQMGGTSIKAYVRGGFDVYDEQQTGSINRKQMWYRLGDCSTINKILNVQIDNGVIQTYTFNQDYATLQTPQEDIIAAVNSVLTGCSLSIIGGWRIVFDNLKTTDKVVLKNNSANDILVGQWIKNDGSVADSNTSIRDILGMAVTDAVAEQLFEVWTADIVFYGDVVYSNGKYGISDLGYLSPSSSTKIGVMNNNVFNKY